MPREGERAWTRARAEEEEEEEKKRGKLACDARSFAVAARFSFFLFVNSASSPSFFSHLRLVVDRQHHLVDARVLEGLFCGVGKGIRWGEQGVRRGRMSQVFILFFLFFFLFQTNSIIEFPPFQAPNAPSVTYHSLPTRARWRPAKTLYLQRWRADPSSTRKGAEARVADLRVVVVVVFEETERAIEAKAL